MNPTQKQFSLTGVSLKKANSYQLACLALISLLLGQGCATSTGTRTHLNEQSLAKVKNLDVCVKVPDSFTVRIARERISSTGAVLGGVIGYGIESGSLASKDESEATKLRPLLAQFDCQKKAQEKFLNALNRTTLFASVRGIPEVSAASPDRDALLEVTLREWCLRPCLSSKGKEEPNLEICLDIDCRLTATGGKLLWSRSTEIRNGNPRPLATYQNTTDLLSEELSKALDRLSARVANELRYAN